ncbi:ATP-binding protein [Robbsia sp. Bb-Pol-6]|uniref:histidine kinase n=1 Tax=Robbsia betulipollinis TaxID=2981849 RepID=A0ABT3ZNH6_9BURK|nr:ATP-binding protein [Robbsia betulipollinis]MCY0387513.1 ATP-binding protein [Robbsia betulipollinis]
MRSIRRVLLVWLLAIVLIGVVLAGILIYRQARAEANALFDYQLRQTAAALPSEPFSSVLGGHTSDGEGVVIQIWSRDGAQLYYSHPGAPLAPRAELGFSTERTPAGDWRVYSAIVGDNVVQLAQPMAIRDLLAAETAWRTIWPLLVLLPVLGLGVWLIVGRGLRPLSRLAHALEARRPEAVDPLPDRRLSSEIRPVVHALNGLLQRLSGALDTQKAFVADAAHELRTPLAALRIQAQLLERAADPVARAEALADLHHGVARATRLVEQLLSLARAEAANDAGASSQARAGSGRSLDLLPLIEACVLAMTPLALEKGIDLGIEGAVATAIAGDADADALRVLLGNVLDNAVKYTPRGGRVDVAAGQRDAQAFIEVVDTGPGIAPAERERVFDRFYRSPGEGVDGRAPEQGSGLGLAIVRRIAERHGAHIVLADGAPGAEGARMPGAARGLRVTIWLGPVRS